MMYELQFMMLSLYVILLFDKITIKDSSKICLLVWLISYLVSREAIKTHDHEAIKTHDSGSRGQEEVQQHNH